MKKSLIALAALATVATAAQAQSSVTIYGIIDAGIASVDKPGTGRVTGVSTGGLATSRLGFRGTEDVGGGLKANFNLEMALGVDAGTGGTVATTTTQTAPSQTTAGALFDRQAWVGLDQANVGTILLGRTTRLDFDTIVAGDAFGAAGFASAGQVTYGQVAYLSPNAASSANSRNRYINSVKANTARFAGLQLAYQHSFGEKAGDNGASRGTAYSLDYTAGKAKATYAYSRQNDTAGAKLAETTALTGSYDFGVAKAFVGLTQLERNGISEKTKANWLGVTAPVTAKVSVMAQVTKFDNLGNAAGTGTTGAVAANDADLFALGATYAFSNRTTAYAMAARASNDGQAALSVLGSMGITQAAATGKDQKGYTIGLRHTF